MENINKYIFTKYKIGAATKDPIQLPITRIHFAELLNEVFGNMDTVVGAEVGVERGKYSEVLFKSIPKLKLWMVDPLIPYGDYRQHVSKMEMDGFYREVVRKFKDKDAIIARDFSMNVVKKMGDNTLDFVYIDANHDFINTVNDVIEWGKKVKIGGIIAGHDYTNFVKENNRCDVKTVLDAYTKAYKIDPWYITSESSPSWFYIKQ